MQISASDWQKYISKLSSINKKAGALLQAYVDKHGMDDIETLITYAHALVTKYGEAGSELACQMYDALAKAQGVHIPIAEPAQIANRHEVAGAILKTQSTGNMIPSIERLVKTAASDTILKNAKRDHAEWAWVSHGDTCAFCMHLSSLGWMPASKAILKGDHAEHIHANCDCEFAIRFDGKSTVEGYNPQQFKKIYEEAEGNNYKDKINAMRRANYANIKEERNARRRELYIPKKIDSLSNLTEQEKYALNKYVGPDSYLLNEVLRKGKKLTYEQEKWCKYLDSALDKLPKYKGDVTRSVQLLDENSMNKFIDILSKNKKIVFTQYLSTTCSKELYDISANVQIKIINSKNGVDLTLINKTEEEILFRRNSSFKVVEYKKINNKLWVLLEDK